MNGKKKHNKKKAALPAGLQAGLLYTLLCLVVIGGLLALSLTVGFPVKKCRPEGATHYTAEQMEAVIGLPGLRMNLFTVDLAALEQKLVQALPYLEAVSFRRRLPGTLLCTVTESKPFLAQAQDGLWWLLDRNGKLLESVQIPPEGVLTLEGAKLEQPGAGKPAKWKAATAPADIRDLLAALEESTLKEDITGLVIGVSPTPEALYQGRIRLVFGAQPQKGSVTTQTLLTEKLRLAAEVLKRMDAESALQRGVLDLSTVGKAYFTESWT
ncbi:MAG: FtsQ-type POTRA domain-containing protein [Oscillospiraceae bacterium]|jgi:hypothetical protein|nr:FtsQ-type POTRA domain-containing protein [Oscillospiraceae bacterium]